MRHCADTGSGLAFAAITVTFVPISAPLVLRHRPGPFRVFAPELDEAVLTGSGCRRRRWSCRRGRADPAVEPSTLLRSLWRSHPPAASFPRVNCPPALRALTHPTVQFSIATSRRRPRGPHTGADRAARRRPRDPHTGTSSALVPVPPRPSCRYPLDPPYRQSNFTRHETFPPSRTYSR